MGHRVPGGGAKERCKTLPAVEAGYEPVDGVIHLPERISCLTLSSMKLSSMASRAHDSLQRPSTLAAPSAMAGTSLQSALRMERSSFSSAFAPPARSRHL